MRRSERDVAAARRRLYHLLGIIAAIDPSRLTPPPAEADSPAVAARYADRNDLIYAALVQARRAGLSGGIGYDPHDPRHPVVVYLQLPTGQVSWHLPAHSIAFDGHSTQQKYHRIEAFSRSQFREGQ
jgi:hypothetical protein